MKSGGSGVRSKVGVRLIGVRKSHTEDYSAWDDLWRPGRAFFQIGLGCLMSHYLSPHKRALHIPVLILVGKFKMEFLPSVSHSKALPVAQIHPNSQKVVSSYIGAFQLYRFVQTRIKSFPIA